MEAAQSTFISSTFWTERIGPTAALASLKEMRRLESWEYITKQGLYIRDRWRELADIHDLDIDIWGIPALSGFTFKHPKNNAFKTLITQEMIKKNFLAANSVYVCIDHKKRIIDSYIDALDKVFKTISLINKDKLDIDDILETKEAFEGFKRLN
jgi:hypothetical protein